MIIRLKDGSEKEYAQPMSVLDIAKDISEGLARNACAGQVNGETVDLRTVVSEDSDLNILTFNDEEGKLAFRHTASHVLAQAVKRLYPEAKLAIGPAIEDGFYYDFDMWQYTHTASVPGIEGNVDMNLAFREFDEKLSMGKNRERDGARCLKHRRARIDWEDHSTYFRPLPRVTVQALASFSAHWLYCSLFRALLAPDGPDGVVPAAKYMI